LLVTFGTGIRTDDLGRIGRNCADRGKAEDHQQAAEAKHGRLPWGHGAEPDRPKAVGSNSDNDFSSLLQRSDPSTSAGPAGCGNDRERAGPFAARWEQSAW